MIKNIKKQQLELEKNNENFNKKLKKFNEKIPIKNIYNIQKSIKK